MLRATAHQVFLNRRIWDTLTASTFGPRRSDGVVTQANEVSWSWHKCRRPTAPSVAPYAVIVIIVSGGPLFRNENKATLFRWFIRSTSVNRIRSASMRTATLHDDDVGICQSTRPLSCYKRSTRVQIIFPDGILFPLKYSTSRWKKKNWTNCLARKLTKYTYLTHKSLINNFFTKINIEVM